MSQPTPAQLPPWERPPWQQPTDEQQYDVVVPSGPAGYGQPPYPGPYPYAPYGPPPYGPPRYGPVAHPYGWPPPPPRNTRKIVLWSVAGGLALLAVVLGVVLLAVDAGPDTVIPAPAATREATGLGEDPFLDRLAQDCHDGLMRACDDLYDTSDLDSAYEEYGDTCAGRRDGGAWAYCADVFSDTPAD
jgi:hypothetical protein